MDTITGSTSIDTKLYLFRELRDQEMRWHGVGPKHERLAFNLIDLVGYASRSPNDAPPFHIYTPFNWKGAKVPENSYSTIDEAKKAGREWALAWLAAAGSGPVIWEALHTGVHWRATADGVDMASYYYCPKKTKHWHKDFRVWFGGTYYLIDFKDQEAARAEVERTWRIWLSIAKDRLLNPKSQPADLVHVLDSALL